MARYCESVCRLCRREGLKLFLKGDRCYSEKCAIERREYPPGQHGQGRKSKLSEFGLQLREKQKVKQYYGVLERQFRRIFEKAERTKGITGETLLKLLESRLDNMVYRMGFANSRNEARLLVTQSHFIVNGKKVNIPSYFLKPGDTVSVKEKSRKVTRILGALEASERRGIPEWITLDKEQMMATIKALPLREQITMPISENLIVESYSK
ncbi:MAG: 30S ribosomal protein S4 [Deltaproteobacteria bacterium RIFCSPLOWO2_12_FULL_40_28]|nr:MAG: 30S ribosomal protein S4 [Deltaproteobacteria bacterium RIFCSPHIGHO2_02_FULL_40_28]OGQ18984.1 MAG: 30S ribosomal protein S4 [Deltaproteobacteria bacterium RIFCSPHIGHO2_12_FULL_40_32]OGQ39527.1 MAG: 30S ribosomal protein S4 [Deltaproteobacteria bacterium RIFCSPLOWO2_02_FULL_40_36]OGQ53417.1 MAG: 30S ribosomal protein S4 [Deltaproteobacteria bacterium RIFCSPLOWO2_12_FULL_40_28]